MSNNFVLTPVDVMKDLLANKKDVVSPLGVTALHLAQKGFEKNAPVSTRIELPASTTMDYMIGDPDTGGVFQEITYWQELITLLRDQSVIRANTPRVIPVPTGKLQVRRQTEGSVAYWVGEGQNITKSKGTYEAVYLIPKKLAGIAVFSNDVLRYTAGAMAQAVQNDLVETIATKEDETFLLSDGTSQNTPKGLYGYAPSANKLDYNDMTSEVDAVKKMLGKLAAGKSYKKPIWIMNPQAKIHLQFLQNDVGAFVFPEVAQNLLAGFPIFTTTLLAYSGTPKTTKVFLVDSSELIIAQGVALTLEFFPNGTYYDGTGVVSGISADESVYRVIEEVDFFIRHNTSVVVLENVPWGA